MGSITRLPDGGWRLRYLGPDGRRREGGRFATRAEAEQAQARLRTSILGGTWRPRGAAESPMLSDYAAAWSVRSERSGQLAPSTAVLYRRLLQRLVFPDVGGVELDRVPVGKLTRATVMAWELGAQDAAQDHADAHTRGLTGSTGRRREGPLARACARANNLAVPRTGRLPDAILEAWREAGSPASTASLRGRCSGGDRSSRPGRRCRQCAPPRSRTASREHPVRIRPGTKPRCPPGGAESVTRSAERQLRRSLRRLSASPSP